MKKIAFFWDMRFEGNKFLDIEIDRNLSPFIEFSKINGPENTISSNLLFSRIDKNEFIIYCFLTFSIFSITDYIKLFYQHPRIKKVLFLFEPSVVAPMSYFKIVHLFFDRIFTWDDSLVDDKKYFKFIWPQSLYGIQESMPYDQKKYIVLMNANKTSFGKNELYTSRNSIIRFFEKNNVEFDLYGAGWGRANLRQKIFGYNPYPSWRGRADDKIATISQYKFNICFENMSDTPGYITEKIWDSFKAKTVPVYWGASNIEEYIPKNCFIDYRDFLDFEKLEKFLSQISKDQYNEYIENIEKFMGTKEAKKWFDEEWAKGFLKGLL